MKTLAALMIAMTAMTATTTLVFAQQPTAPQSDSARDGEARVAAIRKLRADLDQAVSRANFTEEQRHEMTSAQETLRKQTEHRRKGDKPDRVAIRRAMQTIRGMSASNAFQAEDRETLRKDLIETRKFSKHRKADSTTSKRKSAA